MPDKRRTTAFGLDDFAPEQISPTGRKSLPDYNHRGYGGARADMGFGPYGPIKPGLLHQPKQQLRPIKLLPSNINAGRKPVLGKGGMQTQTGRVKSSTTPMTFPSPHSPDGTTVGSRNENMEGLRTVGGKYDTRTYPYEGNREAQLMRNQFKTSINQVPAESKDFYLGSGVPQEKIIETYEQGNPPTVDPYNRAKREQVGGINQYEKRRAFMMLQPDRYPEVAATALAPAIRYLEPFSDAIARHDQVRAEEAPLQDMPTEDTASLVRDLASPNYRTRELAALELKKQGGRAMGELKKASMSKDLELRLAAQRQIADIEELRELNQRPLTGERLMDRARATSFFGVDENSASPEEMDAMRRQFMNNQYRLQEQRVR